MANTQPGAVQQVGVGSTENAATEDIPEVPWIGSPQWHKAKQYRKKSFFWSLGLLAMGMLAYWFLSTINITSDVTYVVLLTITYMLIGAGFGALVVLPWSMSAAKARFEEIRQVANVGQKISDAVDSMAPDPTMANLMHLNRTETIGYHTLTLEQATKSFKNSQRSMAVGLIVIVLCIGVVSVPMVTSEVRITVAALGAISTTLSGYITRTFLKSHSEALSQLNRYFNQPLVTSYLLNAERIASTLEGQLKHEALNRVVAQALYSAAQAGLTEEPSKSKRATHKKASAAVEAAKAVA